MRILRPPAVYISDRVREDARCMARVERMMTRIECDNVLDTDDDALARLVEERQWHTSRRLTGDVKQGDPPIVFSRFRWLTPEGEAEYLAANPGRNSRFFGFHPWRLRDREHVLRREQTVCQSAWELHTAYGCLFKCAYCNFPDCLVLLVDLEEWLEHVAELVAANPWQSLYKYDSTSDILTFEPEYGASALLVPWFAEQPNAWLMHYTKSANVDPLLDLDHRGHTIVCWSLTNHTQSRVIDIDSAPMEERIEAMRKCQEAGYPVRCRFSPMVPIKGWERENREMIRLLLSKVKPDVIALQTLSRFPTYDIVERVFDEDLLDPRFVEAMRARPDEVRGKVYGPIPHALRKEMHRLCIDEIRRLAPDVPVSICLESGRMWEELGPDLGIRPEAYPCTCGGACVPGNPVMGAPP